MKSFIGLIIILTVVTNSIQRHKRHRHKQNVPRKFISSEDDENGHVTGFDLNGTLRKFFVLDAVLDYPERSRVCSPISALLPLGQLVLGADEEATSELIQVMGIESKAELKRLIDLLEQLPGVKYSLASRLYLSDTQNLDKAYEKRIKTVYKSTPEKMNFKDPDGTAAKINAFVERETYQQIQDIVSPRDIPLTSSIILVNAVYFEGSWAEPFSSAANATFHAPTGSRPVPMMVKRSDQLLYGQSDYLGAELVEIPYMNGHSTFLMILPKYRDGLPVVLRKIKLSPLTLAEDVSNMRVRTVSVTMPKFKIESELDLKTLYQKIGLNNIFDSKRSQLTKILDDGPLYVSAAKQKAAIEVTEKGTKAAASSVIVLQKMSYEPNSVNLIVDRPFLFYVKAHGQPLFAGTYTGDGGSPIS